MKINVEKLVLGMVSTNVYFISYNGNCLIVDPSAEVERIIAYLEENNLTPIAILITHGHFDHAMAASELADEYKIKIYVGAKDKILLENPDLNLGMRFLGENFTLAPDILVKGGDELDFKGFKLKVIETPGHTVGSVSYYSEDLIENDSFKKVIFTGDSLFAGSVGRMDFPTGSRDEMSKTIEIFKGMDPETVVFPGHGVTTTIKREIAHNPYLTDRLDL